MILDVSISLLRTCHFCQREKGTFKCRHGIQKRSWDTAWAPNTWASASLPWSSVPPPLTMGSSGEVFCPAGPCPPLPCHPQSHTQLLSILPRTRDPSTIEFSWKKVLIEWKDKDLPENASATLKSLPQKALRCPISTIILYLCFCNIFSTSRF